MRQARLLLAALLFTPLAHAATPGDKAHGAQLYQSSGCTQCHGDNRRGTGKGPDLANVHKRLSDDKIHQQIANGGGSMPPFGDALAEQDIQDLIAFLHTKAPKAPKPPKSANKTPPPAAKPDPDAQ